MADDEPSRFIDNLPAAHVEVVESKGASQYGAYGVSRFANLDSYGSSYTTPGWKRAQSAQKECGAARRAGPRQTSAHHRGASAREIDFHVALFAGRARLHLKFGPGTVTSSDGSKLTVDFDKAGRKMVMESFVDPA